MNSEYKTLTNIPKFRGMVLQNFPFIEEDFDALTDYAFLCKVVEYLNKVIEQQNLVNDNTNALYQAYIQLKNYVDNYFDNLDVQEEINNKLDEMAEDGSLENLINTSLKEKINIMYNHDKFNPIVYASMYSLDDNVNTIKTRILKWKKMGCKGIIVLINFNNDENLTIQDDLAKVKNLMEYAKENGLLVNTIKFHCLLRNRVDNTTLTTYENQVNYVLNTLEASNFGISRITLFNELPYVYGPNATNETKTKAISIINNFKNNGYEVGITCSNLELGIGYMIQYSSDLCAVVDFFAYNYYQVFPFKKDLTTKEDSIYAWNKGLNALYNYKSQFPSKKIIMSETGCLDNWLNMMNPADFTLNQYPANGKTYPIYFYGLLNNEVAKTNLSELWLWYDEVMTNYDSVIDFFRFYLNNGGEDNE